MNEQDKSTRIEELRKRLASGRVNSASEDADGNAATGTRTHGGGLQALFGQGGGTTTDERDAPTDTRGVGSDERGTDEEFIRKRSSFVRLSNDHSRSDGASTETRSASRFVADDSIPKRIFQEDADNGIVQENAKDHQKTGTASKTKGFRSAKNRASQGSKTAGTATRSTDGPLPTASSQSDRDKKGFKLPGLAEIPGLGKGKTLNSREADQLRDGFREALADDFDYLDQWLRTRTGDPGLQIWSNVDEEELDKVTEVFLRSAQRSPIVATVVRETINTHDYIVTGMVFLPRFAETVKVLRDARAKQGPRPGRWQRMAVRRQTVQTGVNGNAQS